MILTKMTARPLPWSNDGGPREGGIKSAWIAKELSGLGASPGRRTQLATQAMSAHDCDCTDNTIATFEVTAAAGAWCFGVMLAALRGFSILPFDVLLHAPPHLDQTRQT
jgi:hypothetical protein